MESFDLARTQLEVAYLNSKLTVLTSPELAIRILGDWIELDNVQTSNLVKYCAGVRYPASTAAHLYYSLGFTYAEISQFVGKSAPTIANYLKRSQPLVPITADNTPYSEEYWERIRTSLGTKKNAMLMYGFTAKESIL